MWKSFNHLSFTEVQSNVGTFELVFDETQKKFFLNADKVLSLFGYVSNSSGKVKIISHLEKNLTIFPEISGNQRFISVNNAGALSFNSHGCQRNNDFLIKLKSVIYACARTMTTKKDLVKVDLSYNQTINVLGHECQYTNQGGKISIALNDLAKSIGYADGLSFKANVLDTFSTKSETKYGPTRFIPLQNFYKLSNLLLLRDRRHSLHKAYQSITKKLKLNDYFFIENNHFIFNSFAIPYIVIDGDVLIHSYSFLNYISMDSKCIEKPAAFRDAFLHDNDQYYVSLEEIEAFYKSTRNKDYKEKALAFLSKRQRINYATFM